MNITDKKVLVVGLGRSGTAASKLLLNNKAKVFITEKEDNEETAMISKELTKEGAVVELGRHTKRFVEKAELIVISPGVEPKSDIMEWAKKSGIPIISEIELAGWFISSQVIAVTGTNGKSTVVSLIEHIFNKCGKSAIACGNIGLPLSEVVLKKKKYDAKVVELSSFQLQYIHSFRPNTVVWLNFASDHLDHHASMEEYLNAKLNIFKNQKDEDYAVIYYKEIDRVKNRIKCNNIEIYPFINDHLKNKDYSHVFQENIYAALTVAEIYGIRAKDALTAVETFQQLPHRQQNIATVNGVDYIDDSKATNVASVIAALDNINGSIILILGGKDKGDDFTKLKGHIKDKVAAIISIGETKDKISEQLTDTVPVVKMMSLNDAVKYAAQTASYGSTVLLSPGCSSFDMFKDYRDRGKEFQKSVNKLVVHNKEKVMVG